MRLRITRWRLATVLAALLLAAIGAYSVKYVLLRHHFRQAQEAMEDRDFREASAHLNSCLLAWPRDPAVRILAVQNARRQGDFEEAWRHLRVHQRQKGPETEYQREYQLLLVQQGDEIQVAELFELCLRDPPPPDVHLCLEAIIEADVTRLMSAYMAGADVAVDEGAAWRARADKAIELWRRQRQRKADQVQACLWAGRLNMTTDKLEAIASFRQGLELDPTHTQSRLLLAIVLTEYDPREAATHLESLRRQDPKNQQVAVGLAGSLRALGNLERAETLLEEVLAANPAHLGALLERGKTALDAGRPGDAEPFLRRALTQAPNEPFVHLALSRCLQLTGKSDAAQYHEKRYGEIESQRRQSKRMHDDEARAIWRKRLERSAAQADKP
jgi:tetratricopeptide (TPR) repeat protein